MSKTKAKAKSPRKPYHPKPIHAAPHLLAIYGAAWVDAPTVRSKIAALEDAVEHACQAKALHEHWRVIFDAVNTLEAMIELKIATGAGVQPIMYLMDDVLDRIKNTGHTGLLDDEQKLLRELASTYARVLPYVTCSELDRAESRVCETISRVLADKGVNSPVKVIKSEDMHLS